MGEPQKEEDGADTEHKAENDAEDNTGDDGLKEEMEGDEGKNEMVIDDDGNWKRAKKREDEEDEDGEDEVIDERLLDQDDDENQDADQDQSIENIEATLAEQASSASPRLEEEAEEDAADIQAIKEEACQITDLDFDGDIKSA